MKADAAEASRVPPGLRAALKPFAVLQPLAVPLALMALAGLAALAGPRLPPSLAGLKTFGPGLILVAAAGVTLWFNRGRAFVMALALLAAYAGYREIVAYGPGTMGAHATLLAIAVLVPVNVFASLMLRERGTGFSAAWPWLAAIVAQAMLIAWFAGSAVASASVEDWRALFGHWAIRAQPVPLIGRLAFAAAFGAAVWRCWPRFGPLETGKAVALVAFYVACSFAENSVVFAAFMSAAGAILLASALQESYRLAFHDELTGLPGRRALDERMRALGAKYAIAMVDIDHFKKFNDTHGHDIGDQVLKLVAARLAEVGGGGRAYRYGGEEFCVLFPERGIAAALPQLETLREAIAHYKMSVRGGDRPKNVKEGAAQRGEGGADKVLSVTVSMGVSAPGRGRETALDVIKAADEALYRAKEGGRNRVSR